jgi:hypothetical protein
LEKRGSTGISDRDQTFEEEPDVMNAFPFSPADVSIQSAVSGEKRDLAAEIEKAEAELAAIERGRDQAFIQVTQLRRTQLAASSAPQLRLPMVPDTVFIALEPVIE